MQSMFHYPSEDEVTETFNGMADGRMRVKALGKQLQDLGVTRDWLPSHNQSIPEHPRCVTIPATQGGTMSKISPEGTSGRRGRAIPNWDGEHVP